MLTWKVTILQVKNWYFRFPFKYNNYYYAGWLAGWHSRIKRLWMSVSQSCPLLPLNWILLMVFFYSSLVPLNLDLNTITKSTAFAQNLFCCFPFWWSKRLTINWSLFFNERIVMTWIYVISGYICVSFPITTKQLTICINIWLYYKLQTIVNLLFS
jgi:hypothetical protein